MRMRPRRPSPRSRLAPSRLGGGALALFLAVGVAPARADVLVTSEGLVLEGEVRREPDGSWLVTTREGSVRLEADRVAAVREGEGPGARLERRGEALAADDAAAWFRLGLEAEAAGRPDLAREAFERVVAAQPDHAAARRALGQERVEGAWVDAEEARRLRGLVLFEGRWRLAAEVEGAARTPPEGSAPAGGAPAGRSSAAGSPGDDAPGKGVRSDRLPDVVRALAAADGPLLRAARLALAAAPPERRLAAALGTLYDPDPRVRRVSARLLGEWGDEAALRALLLSGARDLDADVRREAVLAAASFGHDDVAIPFVRALGSRNPRLVGQAAEALAVLGDRRAVHAIVRRLESHGSSMRSHVMFVNQVSYVRDYDVEIAQASNIANPEIATLMEGVVLDVRVLDAHYERTWVEHVLVDALSQLAGRGERPFAGRAQALAWYAEARPGLPDFPAAAGAPRGRAPRRPEGGAIGAGAQPRRR